MDKRIALVFLVIGILTACSGNQAATPPAEQAAAATPTVAILPTVPPLATDDTPATEPEATQTPEDPAPAGQPADVTGYELIAIGAGEAFYSGYACAVSPVGCACDEPIIQRAVFEFTEGGQLRYRFAGGGYGSEWLMDRLGPNQWSYTISMYREEGQFEGAYFVLLTFTQDGYQFTQGADLDEGGLVTCPDVFFQRMMSSDLTPEP